MFFKVKYTCKALRQSFSSFLTRYISRPAHWGALGKGSHVHKPSIVSGRQHIFLGDNVNIDWNNVLYVTKGKFVMGDDSGAAVGLTVVTDNHVVEKGKTIHEGDNDNLQGGEVIVDESVWIAANVTLLSGVHIGRGAIIGAGTVLRSCKVPPYAIVIGNPGKVIGFRYTPDDIILHEQQLYPEEKRLSRDILEKNYQKYFRSRVKDIASFVKLQ
ncbi:MAG: acyltransferase [Prevotella sp.]|nr:acyltransferase [Prevotella sp.]